MKKLSFPAVLFIAFMLVMTACSPKTAQPAVDATSAASNALIAEGRLLPVNTLVQAFSISGQVAEVLVDEGETVKAGQVVAKLIVSPEALTGLARAQQEALAAQQALDNLKTSAKVNLAQGKLALIAAQEALDTAQSRYDADQTDKNKALLDESAAKMSQADEAQKKLDAGVGVNPDLLAAAEARLASAEAASTSAQAFVDAHELKASMDGTLVNLNLQAGQIVGAGQAAFTLADYSSWVVKTDNLTEMDVVNVKVGQQVKIVMDALPGQVLSGEVSQINLFSEEKRGDTTYTVTAILSDSIPQMRWGMTAAVEFIP